MEKLNWLIGLIMIAAIVWIVVRRWKQAVGMRAGDQAVIDRKRQTNKRLNNRIVMKVLRAGRRPSFFALVKHTGRKSGKTYVTPVRAVKRADQFIIPLTYGENTDWYKNLQATGSMELQWQGINYRVGKPELREISSAMNNFPLISRFLFWLDGLPAFVQVAILP